jgi:hypothetical protein
MSAPDRRKITFAQFANTFVPFGLLLAAALLLPERGLALVLDRTINTIWVATLLLIPALGLYLLAPPRGPAASYALLLWTFSYLAYLVHFYYGVFEEFGGVVQTFQRMRAPIAATNFVFTAWWTVDVLLAWFAAPQRRWVRVERGLFFVFIYLLFVVTLLFLRPTNIRYLGMVLAIVVPVCWLVGLRTRGLRAAPAAA